MDNAGLGSLSPSATRTACGQRGEPHSTPWPPFRAAMWNGARSQDCAMKQFRGWRDSGTGRVFGFQSEAQRENFMAARARFSNGPLRQMPRCSAKNRAGQPCRAPRMRGMATCFCHSGGAARSARLTATGLSGDHDRIERAQMRLHRNRLRAIWRRDPRKPGRTIALIPADEAKCRAWTARQGLELDALDRDFPAFSDACRWIWARMSRGLISDPELAAKLSRLRTRTTEASRAFNHSG